MTHLLFAPEATRRLLTAACVLGWAVVCSDEPKDRPQRGNVRVMRRRLTAGGQDHVRADPQLNSKEDGPCDRQPFGSDWRADS